MRLSRRHLFSSIFIGGKAGSGVQFHAGNIKIARNAVSLGAVEQHACHQQTSSHSGDSPEELARAGVTDGLVRISVGIEDWRDLLADFEQALNAVE